LMTKIQHSKKKQKKKQKLGISESLTTTNSPIQQTTLPQLSKLTSTDSEDRAWASAAISNLVQDKESLTELLQQNVAGCLVNALNCPPVNTQLEVSGAIRNLMVFGGLVCTLDLEKKNILQIIFKDILPEQKPLLGEGAKPAEELEEKVSKLSFTEQILHILWNLCESSESALQKISNNQLLLPFLLDLMNPAHHERLPYSLIEVAGQFLNTLTEENPITQRHFKSELQCNKNLLLLASGEIESYNSFEGNKVILKVLAMSILYNGRSKIVFDLDESNKEARKLIFRLLFNLCNEIISHCIDTELTKIFELAITSSKVPNFSEIEDGKDGIQSTNKSEKSLQKFNETLNTLNLAIELTANALTSDEEFVSGGESQVEGDDDEMYEDFMEGEESNVDIIDQMEDFSENMDKEEEEVNAADSFSVLKNIYHKVLNLINRIKLQLPNINSIQNNNLKSNLKSVYLKCFGLLQNLFENFQNTPLFGDELDVFNFFFENLQIFDQISSDGNNNVLENDYELNYNIIGAIWGLVKKVEKLNFIVVPSDAQLELLLKGCLMTEAPEAVRIKCISMMGYFGKQQGYVERNKIIGESLMELLIKEETPLILKSEILNSIYDIYADKNFDYDEPNFVKSGFLAKLKLFFPNFRGLVKKLDKRKFRDTRERCEEALLNLKHFILYKEKEL
ncbi:hypothetical protein HK099_008690, partial [Clydaea vesicula]